MSPTCPHQILFEGPGPWIGDGPMGTELLRLGWSHALHGPTHHWNTNFPDLVRAVHQQWVRLGAQILRTNTFSLLPEFHQNIRSTAEVLGQAILLARQGIHVARQAKPKTAVVAAFGPVSPDQGPPTKPLQGILSETLAQADGILLETWSHPNVVDWARWLQGDRNQPLILSGCFRRCPKGNLATLGGLSPSDWVQMAKETRALAVGYNCGLGLNGMDILDLHLEMRRLWEGPLWCFPGPEAPIKGWLTSEPSNFGENSILGGCCGVDIATFRQRIAISNLK